MNASSASSEPVSANISDKPCTACAIVPLEPSLIGDVIRVHREAFHGYMNTRLGDSYLRAFFTWFRQSQARIAIVAREPELGNIIGYVVGAPVGEKDAISRTLLWPAAWGFLLRPWLIFDRQIMNTALSRLHVLCGGTSPPRPDEPHLAAPVISLVGIGVSASACGRGVGRALLEAFERRAIELKMHALRLSVYSHNDVARRLYERCGWTAGPVPLDPSRAMYYWKSLLRHPLP